MEIIIGILVNALVVYVTAMILTGVTVSGFGIALAVAVVLAVVNVLIKPILLFLTLPINVLTLGLFTLVINALLIMLVAWIVPGFNVANFWWALAFGLVMGVIVAILGLIFPVKS